MMPTWLRQPRSFAASTQKYLLGTDGDAFADKTKWSAFIGSIFEVTKTEDGTIPQFGQLTQPSMQPMTEHFGNLCKRMSAATGIHVGQFGIMSDNPSSAEAIYAENEPLILKCKSVDCWGAKAPNILVVAPPRIKEGFHDPVMGEGCVEKSAGVAEQFRVIAERQGVHFLDAEGCEFNQIDFMHLTRHGHAQLAEKLAELVPTLL